MQNPPTIDLNQIFYILLAVFGCASVLLVLTLVWVLRKVRRIDLPPGADFITALRATPLSVVILLDLLDLTLDIFSAPFAWILLGRLGLAPLRTVTVIEALIPGTQFLPTMSIAWVLARLGRLPAIDRPSGD